MSGIGSLPEDVSDRWRFALVGGLLSVPLTTIGYWQTGSELSLSPILLGGALAGFLARRRTGHSRGVGVRVGVVGSLPVLWPLADILVATTGLAGPSWFVAAGTLVTVVLTAGVAVFALVIAVLLGDVGSRVGGWLADFDSRSPPPATGS